jgi:hypothetical protein
MVPVVWSAASAVTVLHPRNRTKENLKQSHIGTDRTQLSATHSIWNTRTMGVCAICASKP